MFWRTVLSRVVFAIFLASAALFLFVGVSQAQDSPPVANAGPDKWIYIHELFGYYGNVSGTYPLYRTWYVDGVALHQDYLYTYASPLPPDPCAFPTTVHTVILRVEDSWGQWDEDTAFVTEFAWDCCCSGDEELLQVGIVDYDFFPIENLTVQVNQPFTLHGFATGGFLPYHYEWCIGPDTASSWLLQYSFSAPGIFPIVCHITDAASQWSEDMVLVTVLPPPTGDICGSVTQDDGSPVEGVTVKVIDSGNNQVGDPQVTGADGGYYFAGIDNATYSVMMVKPLGYSVLPSETQNDIQPATPCADVDFVLTPAVVANNSRSIGYWKHQFDVYLTGRGSAQEMSADLEAFLDVVYVHFDVLGIYTGLETFTFQDAKDVLAVSGGRLMIERAKQQLFALLLNFASGRIGNETVVSDDGRVAAEAVTFAAQLINDSDASNDELAKTICDLINNGQSIASGIIPASSIRYKVGLGSHLPVKISISQNFPNPFNAQTTIQYSLPEQSLVIIEIVDILGRKIETFTQGMKSAGEHQFTWDASRQVSGIYFYRIKAGDKTETKRMTLLK